MGKPFRIALLFAMAALLAAPSFGQSARGRIASGDVLYVNVQRHPELSSSIQVDESGNIVVPFVGPVNVQGLTQEAASARVAESLRSILRNPRVSISEEARPFSRPTGSRTAAMRLEVLQLQNASAEVLSKTLQGMSSPGGSINFDPDTNSLVITDTPDTIQNVINAVLRLDQMQSQLTQVRLETKIAEVRTGALKELGIRWFSRGSNLTTGFNPVGVQDLAINSLRGGVSPSSAERAVSGGSGQSSGSTGGNRGGSSFIEQVFDRRLLIPAIAPIPGQTFLGLAAGSVDIGALVDALVSDNKAKLLANPMTMTVNHKRALIKMVDEFPYTQFGTEISGATSFSVKFLELGIILDVTPHVYTDSMGYYVKMDLKTEVSFPVGSSNGVPIRSVRTTESQPSVRDGQTLVIGGILRDEERNFESKVPGLGNLPVVGALFKRKERSKVRTELMIFVTPTVYERPEDITWDKMIDISENLNEASLIPANDIRRKKKKD